ncbi:MAG: hypothetical protein ACKN9T_04915 [Candidatus Methylumidiphilus sp.]
MFIRIFIADGQSFVGFRCKNNSIEWVDMNNHPNSCQSTDKLFFVNEKRAKIIQVLLLGLGMVSGIAMILLEDIEYHLMSFIVAIVAWSACFSFPDIYCFLFIFPRLRPDLYSLHPIHWKNTWSWSWPKQQQLFGMETFLAGYLELEPEKGKVELERIINSDSVNGISAIRVQVKLIARKLANENNLSELDKILSGLSDSDSIVNAEMLIGRTNLFVNNALMSNTYVANFGRIMSSWYKADPKTFERQAILFANHKIKELITEIAMLQRRIDTQTRPFLKAPEAAILVDKIRSFQSRVSSYPQPLSSEFRQAAGNWLIIAESQYQQLRVILDREPQPQVFRAGDPVNREQEAFIPRYETLGELDRQLSLATGCPGVILYGRRRMGKSTLLRNLEGFLPVSVRIGVLSMQNPSAFTSLADWLALVAEPVRAVWPERERPATPDSLPAFFDLLGECNQRLEAVGQRLLLAIDEYENLDRKLGEGIFPEDLLHMLRESIQTHRRIVWLFAGSHAIEELTNAQWPSYLISARTVEVPAFTAAETRLLLTEPMKHSRLFERDESKRPRFEPGFWGEDGITRIQAETAGWPHLVQLLAETAVDLCNERQRPLVDAALLDDAIAKAVTAGDTVLRQLLKGESTEADWAWLVGFRRHDTLPIPEDEAVFLSLRRRWLVVDAEPGKWRLRVPLLLRWLRERG